MLELESGGPLAVDERRDDRLEQPRRAIRAGRGAAHDLRAYDRRLTDDREKPSARRELLAKPLRQHGRRSREHDDIVRSLTWPSASGVADFQSQVVDAVAFEIAAAEFGERRPDLDRNHVRGTVREQRGEISAPGTDFERPVRSPHRA